MFVWPDIFDDWIRALARILKLPFILERVPVKKSDAAGVTQVARSLLRTIMGWIHGPAHRAPGGVQGQCPGGRQGGRAPGSSGFTYF